MKVVLINDWKPDFIKLVNIEGRKISGIMANGGYPNRKMETDIGCYILPPKFLKRIMRIKKQIDNLKLEAFEYGRRIGKKKQDSGTYNGFKLPEETKKILGIVDEKELKRKISNYMNGGIYHGCGPWY